MRHPILILSVAFLIGTGSVSGQVSKRLPVPTPVKPDTEARSVWILNPVFATGMKCDGFADDSLALQIVLNLAAHRNATVIMPPGTCMIDPAAQISINSAIWLQGSGKFGTILRRKFSSSGGSMLVLNSNGITLSDFTIDGNKGGSGIAAPADSVAASEPLSDITIQRMRFLNSTDSDIVSSVSGAGNYTANWRIEDNDFAFQGNPVSSCVATIACANIRLLQPLRVHISRNRSDNSEQFALFGSIPGAGQVDIGENILTSLGGFGVALGGGVLGASGAHIHHNFISTTSVDPHNLIDVAFWNDFVVDHNVLHHNGVAPSTTGSPSACIADFPPANRGEVDSNFCYATPTANLNVVGIAMGGDDVSIINNFVQDCSSAGISVAVGSQGPARGIRIIGNTTKNNNHQNPGAHAGIELFLGDASPNLAALSDVIIQGNHSYDDQPIKTQGYGIGIGLFGVRSAYTNVIIEGNNITENKVGPFLSNASPNPGFVIRNNAGLNPVGPITAPPVPLSGSSLTNTSGFDVTIYITSGTQPISVAINGIHVSGFSIPAPNLVGSPVRLPANQNITLTYATSGSPSWQWIAD